MPIANKIGIIDKPNTNLNNDLLNIKPHAESLSLFISKCDTPITIGVQGEWGSGKTSLMHLIQEDLDNKCTDENGILHVWVNAWEHSLFSDPQDILFKVLSELMNEITPYSTSPNVGSKFKNRLKNIANSTAKFASLAVVGEGGADVMSEILDFDENNIKKTRNELQKMTNEIVENNKNNIGKIVVYIDDLDRINPVDAVSLLELLKNIFDIEHCVFVLAIDYEVIVKGLKEKMGNKETNDEEFRAYFDKIIQLPFMMPIGQYDIGRYVNHLLIKTGFLNQTQHYENQIKAILSYSIGGNPRSLKRLVNSLTLIDIFATLRDDVEDISEEEDLLLFSLVCLQIQFPTIYSMLVDQSDFRDWDQQNTAFTLTKKKEEKEKEKFDEDFRIAQMTDEFNEEWEKALFRVCYNKPFLRRNATKISKLLTFIDKQILGDKNKEETKIWIEKVVKKTLITNVAQ